MALKSHIPLHGFNLNIVKQCGPALSDIIDIKYQCVATFEGVDFDSDISFGQQKKQTVAPKKRFSVKLPSGVTVSVWKADLTNFKVDAVVNAANSFLQHGAGLAQALCEAGGPQIQMESDNYTKKYGSLPTGEAIVTNAGSLPCKKIIHAVGPQLPYNPGGFEVSRAEPLLERAIMNILHSLQEHHLHTVAIPAISSGLFNYPLPKCANTIVLTVKRYCEYLSRGSSLEEIIFVNNDEPTVREMERACCQFLAPKQYNQYNQHMSNSQATGSNSRSAAKASSVTILIGNVNLTLKKDNIEDQRTDVIVNTTSPERDLSVGKISSALLKKAGFGIQDEIKKAFPINHIFITNPYKLACKEVFHTFCKEKGKRGSSQVLSDSVLGCLWMAASRKHKSIAFPAIGTGALGFTKEEAAQLMCDALANFAQNFPEKMEVYFVIFPADNDTFQVFKDKINYLQHNASQSNFTQEYDNKQDAHFKRASSPQISLCGPSEESIHEAKKWLTDLFTSSGTIDICNNFIQHLSEKQYLQLSRLTRNGVKFEEFLTNGHACLTLNGDLVEDVVVAALQVEAMLCTVQMEFVKEEETEMCLLANEASLEKERKTRTVDDSSPEFTDRFSAFKHEGLIILKVDKVENQILKVLFDFKKKQLGCSSSQKMFQQIPAQFCQMVSQIGFHAECAPPEDPEYGQGIYFARTVKKAMDIWMWKNDQYLYFVEADVLTGESTKGQRGLILPPAKGTDPKVRYDSVSGGSDISVIFSSYQALPRYIITCKKKYTEMV
ncbi:protein mono-ADP-ribosyltransferase PARP9 [Haplochromis burtoni]|uniref:Poly [ADP-ribose] polymerase 9-like n=1 Tax=Haplochromis burtoni TaxID=8153 RepID=A0A3Q2WDV7_HAPBU|nr:protein mono-ADP-ribosyltransferase PARP9 [Haplochromis burtoni]XP_005944171.1 protein mono-ADP-ribosyltransferase PARP9 [Haplochromis burtoni]